MSAGADQIARKFAGPMLFQYIWWLLVSARRQGIGKIYFLARDGYLLREMARLFCRKFHLSIECRYLYCSRMALRMPTYYFIGDEAYDLLLLDGAELSLFHLMERLGLSEAERKAVYLDIGEKFSDEKKPMAGKALKAIGEQLRGSAAWKRYVAEKSAASYEAAAGYLRQEGLLSTERVVIADSGWMGSMQRSLRQLLDSMGYHGELSGFYFGMYAEPKAKEDGSYRTCFFHKNGNVKDKIFFCNNLFECMLAAPHGMTAGYREAGDRYVPVLLPSPEGRELAFIQERIRETLLYTEERLEETEFDAFDEKKMRKILRRLAYRYMAHPTKEEAEYWGQARFCDDVTEGYHEALAAKGQQEALGNYLLPVRIKNRLLKKEAVRLLFWPYGTLAFFPAWKRAWYRWNIYAGEWIKYARQ